jgi:hypothetical protein
MGRGVVLSEICLGFDDASGNGGSADPRDKQAAEEGPGDLLSGSAKEING